MLQCSFSLGACRLMMGACVLLCFWLPFSLVSVECSPTHPRCVHVYIYGCGGVGVGGWLGCVYNLENVSFLGCLLLG